MKEEKEEEDTDTLIYQAELLKKKNHLGQFVPRQLVLWSHGSSLERHDPNWILRRVC